MNLIEKVNLTEKILLIETYASDPLFKEAKEKIQSFLKSYESNNDIAKAITAAKKIISSCDNLYKICNSSSAPQYNKNTKIIQNESTFLNALNVFNTEIGGYIDALKDVANSDAGNDLGKDFNKTIQYIDNATSKITALNGFSGQPTKIMAAVNIVNKLIPDIKSKALSISNELNSSGSMRHKEQIEKVDRFLTKLENISDESLKSLDDSIKTDIKDLLNLIKSSSSPDTVFSREFAQLYQTTLAKLNSVKEFSRAESSDNWEKKYNSAETQTAKDSIWRDYLNAMWSNELSIISQFEKVFRNECESLGFTEKTNPFLNFLRAAIDNNYKINKDTYESIHDAVVGNYLKQTWLSSDNTWNVIYNHRLYEIKSRQDIALILRSQSSCIGVDDISKLTDGSDATRRLQFVLYNIKQDSDKFKSSLLDFISEENEIAEKQIIENNLKTENLSINSWDSRSTKSVLKSVESGLENDYIAVLIKQLDLSDNFNKALKYCEENKEALKKVYSQDIKTISQIKANLKNFGNLTNDKDKLDLIIKLNDKVMKKNKVSDEEKK